MMGNSYFRASSRTSIWALVKSMVSLKKCLEYQKAKSKKVTAFSALASASWKLCWMSPGGSSAVLWQPISLQMTLEKPSKFTDPSLNTSRSSSNSSPFLFVLTPLTAMGSSGLRQISRKVSYACFIMSSGILSCLASLPTRSGICSSGLSSWCTFFCIVKPRFFICFAPSFATRWAMVSSWAFRRRTFREVSFMPGAPSAWRTSLSAPHA
mmetsp:Transcript_113781/g.270930  ORF Transcript_113781/g.270930 Transcript_113781/m.270930 type:complete len:210 (+) Transcript_113781:244-873(+)